MASPSELSLDCKPHSYSMLLKSFGDHNNSNSNDQEQNQSYKIEEFLSRLEEERLKIDAFKRELPLCMQLLTNAMEASRQQLQAFNQGTTRPVLEEFIPIKHSEISEKEAPSSMNMMMSDNKANWMTSAQLWSQSSQEVTTRAATTPPSKDADNNNNIGFMSMSPNKHRNGGSGGAFLPFSKERRNNNNNSCALGGELALASPDKEMLIMDDDNNNNNNKRDHSSSNDQGKGTTTSSATPPPSNTTTSQTHRKARRCWSPDLHRRFVNALQMLGGSQVATPKQIRELMKVDGLTNDEVKSHLQKYRLHTRRPSPSPQPGAPAPQLVVLGGIWVPPEYATAAGAPAAIYGTHHPASHAPPPHYCAATPMPQEFYTAAPPQPLLPPPPPPHHLHMYKAAGQNSSPESEVGGCGERSESIEDGKSESSSWKGESEGERKGLNEESNCSDITLKF
ncbi:myb family transcription factor EFM [Arachis hypogaea]|uniref:myb family transcription factor EFM n=1 Tax=Arachis hypogaea TaxID=3818 RepID=UPI000DEC0BA7|nr:myb family transcription factor EFM [Arachis hypogaea]